jgi:integrase
MAQLITTRTPGVYKLHRVKGTVYVVRWREVDPVTDKARVRDKTFPTEVAARQFQDSVGHTKATGTYVPHDVGKATFREVSEQWLAVQATRVRPRTLENYERTLRLRVLPRFGARRIGSITGRDVEKWVAEMGAVMPSTVKHAIFPLSATMNYALKHGLIPANPCQVVERPTQLPTGRQKRQGHFLTRAQVAAVAAKVAETEPVYGLLIRFAAGTGLRRSEIAGLRVRDLRVRASREVRVERMVERRTGREWVIQEPKSARSRRRVPILDDVLLQDLRRYLASHPRRDELDAQVWPGKFRSGPLNYGAPDADEFWNAGSFYKHVFVPAVAAVGLPTTAHEGVRFHDLRHTCGSQWIEDGIDMFKVSRWLGHHSIVFTDAVYTHVAKEPDDSADIERTRRALGL